MNMVGNTLGVCGRVEVWKVLKHNKWINMSASMSLFVDTSCVKGNAVSTSRPKSVLKNVCSLG